QGGLAPTYLIGGELPGLGTAAFGAGAYAVAEADESDRSFLRYHPRIAVITGIEPDHLEYYGGEFSRMVDAFRAFLGHVKPDGRAFLGIDDPHVRALAAQAACPICTYGFDPAAELRATGVVLHEHRTRFEVWRKSERLGEARLIVPGRHNVQNALAAIGVGLEVGLRFDQIVEALAGFRGPKRRFEVVGEVAGIMIVDDYAHIPAKIRAAIRAAREGWGRRVIAVFQPHRYTRTYYLLDALAASFSEADLIVLTEIYAPPPERPIEGVSGQQLAEAVARREPGRVHFCPSWQAAVETLLQEVRPGDVVLTMGAGDIGKAAYELYQRLQAGAVRAGGM
ncbi:MAG TPA: Mur ligase family protein, partial [Limnochordia bacterium]